jgi:hypothetical protein
MVENKVNPKRPNDCYIEGASDVQAAVTPRQRTAETGKEQPPMSGPQKGTGLPASPQMARWRSHRPNTTGGQWPRKTPKAAPNGAAFGVSERFRPAAADSARRPPCTIFPSACLIWFCSRRYFFGNPPPQKCHLPAATQRCTIGVAYRNG